MPSNSTSANGSFYARYSDGRTANAYDATVSLGLDGLQITTTTPYKRITWPYKGLRAGEPLRSHAIDVLLSSAETPGATLFVPGENFADQLKTRAPHLTARRETWRQARPWLIAVAMLVGLWGAALAAGWSPIQAIAKMLPLSWRERLGDQALASITSGYTRCEDKDALDALDRIQARLAKAASVDKPFKIQVYDWPLMNAFAVPGGKIIITKGLIDKTQSPDEVAGVLAHEMGHGIEMHPEAGIIRVIGLSAAIELMMGGSGGTIANLGVLLAQLGYTRASEREADEVGLKLLKDAGISAKGLGDFFKRVEEIEKRDGEIAKTIKSLDLLRSHPPTKEREELVARQGPYPSTPALSDADWQVLKTICKATGGSSTHASD